MALRRAGRRVWAMALALGLVWSGAGHAQAPAAAQRRKPPPPAAAPDVVDLPAPVGSGADVVPITRYPTGVAPLSATPAPPLRSAVRSRFASAPAISRSPAPQCRSQCSVARLSCLSIESENSQCDPTWTRCLSSCDGLDYARGP